MSNIISFNKLYFSRHTQRPFSPPPPLSLLQPPLVPFSSALNTSLNVLYLLAMHL